MESKGSCVIVIFDKWGIPHIEAENKLDAYRVLGYLHAQDRIFQMELMERDFNLLTQMLQGHAVVEKVLPYKMENMGLYPIFCSMYIILLNSFNK